MGVACTWPLKALRSAGAGRNAGDGWLSLLTAFRRPEQTPGLDVDSKGPRERWVLGLGRFHDYLVKPFAFSELSAHVQVLLRRTHGARDAAEPTRLRLADLELSTSYSAEHRRGQRLELTAKEFLS